MKRNNNFSCLHLQRLNPKDSFFLFFSFTQIIEALKNLDNQIREVLKLDNKVKELAKSLYQHKSLLIMGRGYNFATCMEGALVRIFCLPCSIHSNNNITFFFCRKMFFFSSGNPNENCAKSEVFFCSQKVKELTYMHSEGIMAGELKHGPLALVDDSMPVIMIVMRDPVYIVS